MAKRKETKKQKTRSTKSKRSTARKTAARTNPTVHHSEHRERLHRAKRALRALRHSVFFPKAVIHTTKMHAPAHSMLEEIPEQALIEHWEAIGELKTKGVEIRHSRIRTHPQLLRQIELDAPVSAHARKFASQHGLVIKERKSPWRTHLEKVFG